MKSTLIRAGYDLDQNLGIWSRAGYGGIPYNDGDEAEKRVASVIEATSDLTVLSEELRQYCVDWPSLYHLSSSRANVLRPFERHLGGDVLEIGAGCGAITRYLGECGGNILAVEGSLRRASIARSRTRDLSNVTVVAERFDDFGCDRKFDVVTLIGVLEYASLFSSSGEPVLDMLQRARAFLKPDGILVVAIENQLGLKYFAGALEDHVGLAMYGLEGRYKADQPQTFGRKVLNDILMKAGYSKTSFLAPFPDYKLPNSIIAESAFLAPDFDAAILASQNVPHDPQMPRLVAFSPELVWQAVADNGLALDLSNSFIIAAHNGDSPVIEASSLAWHYSSGRLKPFCKESRFVRAQDGQIEVQYRLLAASGPNRSANEGPLKFRIPERSDYVHGRLLSTEIVEILSRDGWTFEDVRGFFQKYIGILEKILAEPGSHEGEIKKIDGPDCQLPGFFFDIAPHNIIETPDGEFHLIDGEWDFATGISAGFLMFRALLNIIAMTTRIGHSEEKFESTSFGLISAIMVRIGWPVTNETLVSYTRQEATNQVAVRGGLMKLGETLDWLRNGALVRNNLSQVVNDDSKRLSVLTQTIAQRDRKIAEQDAQILLLERTAAVQKHSFAELHASTSWRVTAPLRTVSRRIRQTRRVLQLVPDAVAHSGGIGATGREAYRVLRREGIEGLRSRLRFLGARRTHVVGTETNKPMAADWQIVPYYVDPKLDVEPSRHPEGLSVAVHLHLFHDDMLEEIAGRLANIPCRFDLFVSVSEGRALDPITERLKTFLPRIGQLLVENVPNKGGYLGPLIVQFGARLSRYAIIGHFHTDQSRQNKHLNADGKDLLDSLLGTAESTGGRIAQFFELLQTRAKVIYPERRTEFVDDEAGWAESCKFADDFLKRYTRLSVDGFPHVHAPVGAMFWARVTCLQELLNLPLSFSDFPEEPTEADGTLVHALERLILVFAWDWEGQFLSLQSGDSIPDYRNYEEYQDFSSSIVHDDIKVLAYYLPQFHPIPENDEWHGKGFTEWTKVRAANPLFEGHYQQHLPHPDIGYYLLDSPETLRRQASLMHSAGVHGMVFYHYWFGGRLILEHPARMLLETPDIAMPYCFCWANENWTRRWDGNESEILLAQNYSPEDARDFIRYLIPFFKDPRHLRIEGRPILFVYRPSSIPDLDTYADIWARECRAVGLPAPYLVAVLTRGAAHPREFRMDAGVERVLHDWTGGGAPEIKETLASYAPINGSVLSYDDVADFYSSQTDTKDFTYFRSLVPAWDNTARYGSEAYVVHGSTPQRFQKWLESAISYSKRHLAVDRRLILVNAWNEWAEGAHLEPDTRYGYAYLNAVGRALSDVAYSAQINSGKLGIEGTRIHLTFTPDLLAQITSDIRFAQRFCHVLARSSIFTRCVVTIDPELHQISLPAVAGSREQAELILEFRKVAFFGPLAIEKMVQTALAHREAVIAPNFHQGELPMVLPVAANGSIEPVTAYHAPMLLYPANVPEFGFKKFRLRANAQCFIATPNTEADGLPAVTTIIRVHKSADFELLRNALCSLVAMRNCICIPMIAAQDLSEKQTQALTELLADLPWYPGASPKVHHYRSEDGCGDLRSKMLNESLRKVETRYAGFLDYDDLLLPHAYEFLIGRLRTTRKAVSFGRVFSTAFSNATGLFVERSRSYEYGSSYEEFVAHNLAPLHSFLIDMTRIDLTGVVYHDDQRYMEDYFLTLQIFTKDNCDWDSLSLNVYIGDYLHSIDRSHTLAFINDAERQALLKDAEYVLCENRIVELRTQLAQRAAA